MTQLVAEMQVVLKGLPVELFKEIENLSELVANRYPADAILWSQVRRIVALGHEMIDQTED